MRWFESHNACPICRYDLRQYREPVVSETVNIPPPSLSTATETPIPTTTTPITTTESNNFATDVTHLSQNIPNAEDTVHTSSELFNMRRNISISEFLPILENILDTGNSEPRRNISETNNTSSMFSEETTNLLNNRFSQILSDIIMEQIPTTDMSNNLLYTIEIPITW